MQPAQHTVLAAAANGLPQLIWRPSPNFSIRTRKINQVVIHDTEGSCHSAVSWFGLTRSGVSSHFVLSEDGTQAIQMVPLSKKAWHACAANSFSIGIEMAGFESKGFLESEWEAVARMTAYLCHRYGIPVQWARGVGRAGIARHYDLGIAGGGHKDPTLDSSKWQWFLGLVAKQASIGGWPDQPWGRE